MSISSYAVWSGAIVIGIGLAILLPKFIHSRQAEKELVFIKTPDDLARLFKLSAADIKNLVTQYTEQTEKELANIINVKLADRTFENTAQAMDRLSIDNLSMLGRICGILNFVSPDKEIRDAAHEAILEIENFGIEHISNNKKLYQALRDYAEGNSMQEALTNEQKYFLKEELRGFERAGLALPDEQLAQVSKLKKELADLTLAFEQNVSTDKSSIIATREELDGVSQAFLDNLQKTEDGRYIVTITMASRPMILEHCNVEKTRKAFWHAYTYRACPANQELLKKIIEKRHALAKLLSFDSYAALEIDGAMAKTPAVVDTFLHDLLQKSKPKMIAEFKELCADLPDVVKLEDGGKIAPWNLTYIQDQLKQKKFEVDEMLISQYFPVQNTFDALMKLYGHLLNLSFEPVEVKGLWHPEVKVVSVTDKDTNTCIGYLIFDLYPRPDKYSHACAASLIPSIIHADGSKSPAATVIIANFPRGTAEQPALFSLRDVSTFFHECGHALHGLLGRTHLASQSGTHVKQDFVEVPSQLFEDWIYEKEILRMISKHYQTNQPLPDELIEKIVANKKFGQADLVSHLVFNSLKSLYFFQRYPIGSLDTLSEALQKETLPHVTADPEWYYYPSFIHLMGYGSSYYCYLWALVYAKDIFETFKQEGLLNQSTGKRLKEMILAKGGSAEPMELLVNFLGRQPSQNAFIKSMGLE